MLEKFTHTEGDLKTTKSVPRCYNDDQLDADLKPYCKVEQRMSHYNPRISTPKLYKLLYYYNKSKMFLFFDVIFTIQFLKLRLDIKQNVF